jgi:hypothetical protein
MVGTNMGGNAAEGAAFLAQAATGARRRPDRRPCPLRRGNSFSMTVSMAAPGPAGFAGLDP